MLNESLYRKVHRLAEDLEHETFETCEEIPEFMNSEMEHGNAFFLMGYTANAMKECGLGDEIEEMLDRARSSDYDNLCNVCDEYIQKCNQCCAETDDEYDEEPFKSEIEDYEDVESPNFYEERMLINL